MELGDLLLRPLLDGDGVTIGRCAIDAAARSTHKERNPMGSSDKRQVVRAHLVGHITIGRNDRNPPAPHAPRPDASAARWPRRRSRCRARPDTPAPRRITQHPGGGDVFHPTRRGEGFPGMGSRDHPQGRAHPSGGNRPSVAVMQHTAPRREEAHSMVHQLLGQGAILRLYRSGESCQSLRINRIRGRLTRPHSIQGPGKVHRRGTG